MFDQQNYENDDTNRTSFEEEEDEDDDEQDQDNLNSLNHKVTLNEI